MRPRPRRASHLIIGRFSLEGELLGLRVNLDLGAAAFAAAEALAIAVRPTHKYALNGRDPNGYTGA